MTELKINYGAGRVVEIEVGEEFALEYARMERSQKLSDRKEIRRHQSLDKSMEHGFDVADARADVFAEVSRRNDINALREAVLSLEPDQRRLINMVFFEDKTLTEIAKENGVSKQAVSGRLKRIYLRLKKICGINCRTVAACVCPRPSPHFTEFKKQPLTKDESEAFK